MSLNTEETKPGAGERLAKVMARAGLCSRRDAEKWIADGRVSVDGSIVTSPAVNVTGAETILIDGVPLAARHGTRLWLYHKPAGLVVTEKDPEGRPTIFEKLEQEGLPRVLTVGRLDLNTEGLLLLTNDGGLKRVLELPATGWLRKYRVRAFGSIDQARLDTLKQGISVEGILYGPIEAVLERVQGGNVWLLVSLREGKNREVKNVLAALGLTVNRLIRVSYGPFQLGDLAPGAVTLVKAKVLRDQLGDKLAREAGVDFDSAFPDDLVAAPAQKPSKNPRDPNARLRPRVQRADKKTAAPKPKTGEPRLAKARATGKLPPLPRTPRGYAEEKPATRRVLFDDGRQLVEEAPRPRRREAREDGLRPRRDGRDDGAREPARDRSLGPRGRTTGTARPDRPERGDRDNKGAGPRSGAPRTTRFGDKPVGRGSDRPAGRPGGKPAGRFGDKPREAGNDKPRNTFGDKPRNTFGDKPRGGFGDKPRTGSGDKPRAGFGDRSRGNYSDKPRGVGGDKPQARTGGRPPSRTGGKPGFSKPSGNGPSRPRGPGKPASPRDRGPKP